MARGRGARVSEFFTQNPNLKKKIYFFSFFFFLGGGGAGRGCVCVRRGVGLMDGQTNRPKPICPFNFFEAGGITMP